MGNITVAAWQMEDRADQRVSTGWLPDGINGRVRDTGLLEHSVKHFNSVFKEKHCHLLRVNIRETLIVKPQLDSLLTAGPICLKHNRPDDRVSGS